MHHAKPRSLISERRAASRSSIGRGVSLELSHQRTVYAPCLLPQMTLLQTRTTMVRYSLGLGVRVWSNRRRARLTTWGRAYQRTTKQSIRTDKSHRIFSHAGAIDRG